MFKIFKGLLLVSLFVVPTTNAKQQTVYDYLKSDRQFTTLADHLQTQELDTLLSDNEKNVTYFAPTNRAFNAMPDVFRKALFAEDTLLKEILEVHLFEGRLEIASGTRSASFQGALIAVDNFQGYLSFGEARIIESDIQLSNGVVHIVDWVIFPSEIRDRIPSILGRPDNY